MELLLAAKDDLLGVWIDGQPPPLPAKIFWGTMRASPSRPRPAARHCREVKAESGGFMPGTGGGVAALLKVRDADGRHSPADDGPGLARFGGRAAGLAGGGVR